MLGLRRGRGGSESHCVDGGLFDEALPEEVLSVLEDRQELVCNIEKVLPQNAEAEVPPSSLLPGSADQANPPKACPKKSAILKASTFADIKAKVETNPCFFAGQTKHSSGTNPCLERLSLLFPHLKSFVSDVRVSERILSELYLVRTPGTVFSRLFWLCLLIHLHF